MYNLIIIFFYDTSKKSHSENNLVLKNMIESHFHHDIDVINARLYEYIDDIS